MEKKKAYIYTRVSTAMQVDGYSLEAQEERLRRHCEYHDMEIVRTYTDKGKSGSTIVGREQFQQMLNDIESQKDGVSYVLVYKLSRFGRNAYDIHGSLRILTENNVYLVAVEDGIDTSTKMGETFALIMAALAQAELSNIHEQTFLGRQQKAREGKWNGGMSPLGYQLVDGKLIIDEAEAAIVRRIFDLYTQERPLGIAGVVKQLLKEEVKRPPRQNRTYGQIGRKLVSDVLENPIYTGQIAYGRRHMEKADRKGNRKVVNQQEYILVQGEHTPIISLEQFQAAQELRKGRSNMCERRPDNDYVHLLSPMLRCPECGASMYGNTTRKRKKTASGEFYADYHFYACKHRRSIEGKTCTYKKNWNNKDIDGPVVEIVTQLINDPKLADYIRSKLTSVVDAETVEADIAKLEKALKRTQANKRERYKELDDLDPSDPVDSVKIRDTKASIDNLSVKEVEYRQDLAELRNKLVAVKQNQLTKETVLKVLSHFSLFFDRMTPADKQVLLRSLVEEIQIFPEKTEDGRIIKSIKLCVPVVYENENTPKISWDKLTPVETVVLLSRELVEHQMKLYAEPFEKIKSGQKTIELRLWDEKRQKIKIGDTIVFTNTTNGEKLQATVLQLHRFNSFEELYQSLPLLKCGYTEETIDSAKASDMEAYYSAEEQAKYGVVGIELSPPKQITDESICLLQKRDGNE